MPPNTSLKRIASRGNIRRLERADLESRQQNLSPRKYRQNLAEFAIDFAMKSCAYCGRESKSDATHCCECGVAFAAEDSAPIPIRKPKLRLNGQPWLYCAALATIPILYFASFGPVSRCAARMSQATTNQNGMTFTVSYRITYPQWVFVLYRPAFMLADAGDNPYGRYVAWCRGDISTWNRLSE